MAQTRILRIPAVDDFALEARVFSPAGAPRANLLINPATGVRKGYYEPFSGFLAESGFRVVTFDNRGIGGSRPERLRGFEARMQDWAELDSEGVLRWIAAEYPKEPVALFGHSFGGQGLGLFPGARRLTAAVLVATQSGYWGHWSWLYRPRVLFLWYVMIPVVTALLGYFPAKRLGLGEDQPAGVARQWARWGRHRDYLLRDGVAQWEEGYAALRLPILGIGLSDDTYAPQRAMAAILALYRNAEIEHRHVVPSERGLGKVGHFGFFKERFRDSLWTEAVEWLEERLRRSPA
jgi:predicted alpha/beta hydrolase